MVLFGIPPTAPNEFELSRDRLKRGQCPVCGLQTYEIVNQGFFRGTKLVPLTNEFVLSGRCLLCNPFHAVGIVPSVAALPAVPIFPAVRVMDTLSRQSSEPIEEDDCGKVHVGLSTRTRIQKGHNDNRTNIPVPGLLHDQNGSSSAVEHSEKRNPFTIGKTPARLVLLTIATAFIVAVAVLVAAKPALTREQLVKNEIESNVLLRNAKFDELSQNDSRNLALDWLLHSDQMRLNASDPNLDQRYILALFAFEFGSIFMSSTNWLSDEDECKWDGVMCHANGDVYELQLDGKNLTGTLPPEISKLPSLRAVSMCENSLFGSNPLELGTLGMLKELYLNHNQLSGTVPSELGGLRRLTDISLWSNELMGTLPSELGNLEELNSLSAAENMLTGTLPPELGHFSELTGLWLNSNQFTGPLPSEFGNLEELISLMVGNNTLTGTLPPELGHLKELTGLWLDSNQFTGTLPSEFGNLEKLIFLTAFDNTLTGTLPPELGHLRELTDLWLHTNKLLGTLLSELGGLRKLVALSVYDNQFTGTVPSELGNLKQLTLLDLAENLFTGTIPSELGNIHTLTYLDLRSTQLTGTAPSTLSDLQDLVLFT